MSEYSVLVDWVGFGGRVEAAREGMSPRALGLVLDLNHETIRRVERGRPCDVTTFAKLCYWLDSPPQAFFVYPDRK